MDQVEGKEMKKTELSNENCGRDAESPGKETKKRQYATITISSLSEADVPPPEVHQDDKDGWQGQKNIKAHEAAMRLLLPQYCKLANSTGIL
jgi:hypothetical protein